MPAAIAQPRVTATVAWCRTREAVLPFAPGPQIPHTHLWGPGVTTVMAGGTPLPPTCWVPAVRWLGTRDHLSAGTSYRGQRPTRGLARQPSVCGSEAAPAPPGRWGGDVGIPARPHGLCWQWGRVLGPVPLTPSTVWAVPLPSQLAPDAATPSAGSHAGSVSPCRGLVLTCTRGRPRAPEAVAGSAVLRGAWPWSQASPPRP